METEAVTTKVYIDNEWNVIFLGILVSCSSFKAVLKHSFLHRVKLHYNISCNVLHVLKF